MADPYNWEEIQKKFGLSAEEAATAAPIQRFDPTKAVSSFEFTYPFLPPSGNHIYIKGSILKQEARKYKSDFKQYVIQHYGHIIVNLDPEAIYGLKLVFYFKSLVNETYQNVKVSPSKRAKSRYKIIDITNRIKFLEDCIKEAISIDDSHTFRSQQEKRMDPDHPRVEISLTKLNPEDFGVASSPIFDFPGGVGAPKPGNIISGNGAGKG